MANQPVIPRAIKELSFADAIIPLVTLVVLITGAIALFGLDVAAVIA
jgi:NhaC family Na+:H+ antiporter